MKDNCLTILPWVDRVIWMCNQSNMHSFYFLMQAFHCLCLVLLVAPLVR